MYHPGRLQADGHADCRSSRCGTCPARDKAVCAGLDDQARDTFESLARHRRLRKGQTLVWEGDDMPFVASVVEGRLTLSRAARDGGELILGSIGPGGFVGDTTQDVASNTVTAVSETELCLYSKADFGRFASEHPEINAQLLKSVLGDLEQTRSWLFMVGRGSASERVASVLMDFAGDEAQLDPDYAIDRTQIAFSAGVAMETVSRHLTRFVRAGIIALPSRDRFTLIDRGALSAIAGHAPSREIH